MTRVVYKASIHPQQLDRENGITLPIERGARIVHVAMQGQAIALWYECVPNSPLEARQFHVVPTGADIPPKSTYRGTAVIDGLVFHVYQENN